jgi:hypothetical protein
MRFLAFSLSPLSIAPRRLETPNNMLKSPMAEFSLLGMMQVCESYLCLDVLAMVFHFVLPFFVAYFITSLFDERKAQRREREK